MIALIVAGITANKTIRSMSPGVTRVNFDRVSRGMTKAEVEGLLGKQEPPYDDRYGLNANRATMRWRWTTDFAYAVIEFDAEENVVATEWWVNIPDEDMLGMLKRVISFRPPQRSGHWRWEP